MLYVPEWFRKPAWVKTFNDLRDAVAEARARRSVATARHKTLRSKWRAARAGL